MTDTKKNDDETGKIGFVGLGAMGAGMVDNLLDAGCDIVGFDLRQEALDWLKERGGRPAASPADAAEGADLLILMVVNDGQVEAAFVRRGWCARGPARGRHGDDVQHGSGKLHPCARRAPGRAWDRAFGCAGERRSGRRTGGRADRDGVRFEKSVRSRGKKPSRRSPNGSFLSAIRPGPALRSRP